MPNRSIKCNKFRAFYYFYRAKIAVANTEPKIRAAQTIATILTKRVRLSITILPYTNYICIIHPQSNICKLRILGVKYITEG